MKFPEPDWMKRYAEVVNQDPELRLVGRFFTCDVLLDFETARYLVRVLEGRSARSSRIRPSIAPGRLDRA